MMKRILLPLLGIVLLTACEKESAAPVGSEADQTLDFRSEKVTVCHLTGSETNAYEIIEIADQAWMKSHMEHGDFLLPTWYADADGDGFGDPATSTTDCVQPEGYVADNTDCDDTDADEFPGQTWYIDADEDGFGVSSVTQCERPADGYLLSELNENSDGTDDCDDTEATVYPGAEEICSDGLDNDCDGDVDGADSDCSTSCVPGELGEELEVEINTGSETYILYVYPVDNSTSIRWSFNGGDIEAWDVWDGDVNTDAIVANQGPGTNYAAGLCNSLKTDGCDWYLPSGRELIAMYQQLGSVDNGYGGSGDMSGEYWSSTNVGDGIYGRDFDSNSSFYSIEAGSASCRCVRR